MQGQGHAAVGDLGGSIITGIDGNPLAVLAAQLNIPLHEINTAGVPLYLEDGRVPDPAIDKKVCSWAQPNHRLQYRLRYGKLAASRAGVWGCIVLVWQQKDGAKGSQGIQCAEPCFCSALLWLTRHLDVVLGLSWQTNEPPDPSRLRSSQMSCWTAATSFESPWGRSQIMSPLRSLWRLCGVSASRTALLVSPAAFHRYGGAATCSSFLGGGLELFMTQTASAVSAAAA